MKRNEFILLILQLFFLFTQAGATAENNIFSAQDTSKYRQFVFTITISESIDKPITQTAFKIKGHPWLITSLHGFLPNKLNNVDFTHYQIFKLQDSWNRWVTTSDQYGDTVPLYVSGIDILRDLAYIDISGIPTLEAIEGFELYTKEELQNETSDEVTIMGWGDAGKFSADRHCFIYDAPIRPFYSEINNISDSTTNFLRNELLIPSLFCDVVPINKAVFFDGNSGTPIISNRTKKLVGIVAYTVASGWPLAVFLDGEQLNGFKSRQAIFTTKDEKILNNASSASKEYSADFKKLCGSRIYDPELTEENKNPNEHPTTDLFYDPVDSIAKAYHDYWYKGTNGLTNTEYVFMKNSNFKGFQKIRITRLRDEDPVTFQFLRFMNDYMRTSYEDGKNEAIMKKKADSLNNFIANNKITSREREAWHSYGMDFQQEIFRMIIRSNVKYHDRSHDNIRPSYIEKVLLPKPADSIPNHEEIIKAMRQDVRNLLANPTDVHLIERLIPYTRTAPEELQAELLKYEQAYADSLYTKLEDLYNTLYSMVMFTHEISRSDSACLVIKCGIGVAVNDTFVFREFSGYPLGEYNDKKTETCAQLIADANWRMGKYLALLNDSIIVKTEYTGEADAVKWRGNVEYKKEDFTNNKMDTLWVISKDTKDDPKSLKDLREANSSYKKNKAIAFLRAYYAMEKIDSKTEEKFSNEKRIVVQVNEKKGPYCRGIKVKQTFYCTPR
jgi:hypothetical protein